MTVQLAAGLAQVLADDDLLHFILAKVEPSPEGWAPLVWLSCANVYRQWRRLMFELPLVWCFDAVAMDEVELEQVRTTKLRFKTIVSEERWKDGWTGSTPLLSVLMFDPDFQQQQGSTLSSITARLPSSPQFSADFNKLACSYPMLVSMTFERDFESQRADAIFDAKMIRDWHQLRTLGLVLFSGADLSVVPRGLHTLRMHSMDLQVSNL